MLFPAAADIHVLSACNVTQVILSAFCQAGKLGLSYYNIESASLHFMKDTVEREDYLLFLRGMGIYLMRAV